MQYSVSTYQAMQDRVQEILINITHNQIITQRITLHCYGKGHHSNVRLTRHSQHEGLKITRNIDQPSCSSCNPRTESNPFVAVSMHVTNACAHCLVAPWMGKCSSQFLCAVKSPQGCQLHRHSAVGSTATAHSCLACGCCVAPTPPLCWELKVSLFYRILRFPDH